MPDPRKPNARSFQEFDRTASSYDTMDDTSVMQHDETEDRDVRGRYSGTAMPGVPVGRHYRPAARRDPDQLVNSGIAWFSVALGVTQLVAPDALARLIGVRPTQNTRTAMRAIGVRELTTGFGLLSNTRSSPWLWSRLAGDMVDLSLIGTSVGRRADDRTRATRAALAVGGVAALDFYAAARSQRTQRQREHADGFASPEATVRTPLSYDAGATGNGHGASAHDSDHHAMTQADKPEPKQGAKTVRHAVTINRPSDELYSYWRDFGNLPAFMRHLESVTDLGGGRSHWVTRGPGGAMVEWDAEIVADVPGELIAWRSLPGADVQNAGTVRFIPVPAGRGTEVHVELDYDPPAGSLGAVVAKMFRAEPGQQVRDDLKAFKSVMEAGEILYAAVPEKQEVERDDATLTRAEAERAEVRA